MFIKIKCMNHVTYKFNCVELTHSCLFIFVCILSSKLKFKLETKWY